VLSVGNKLLCALYSGASVHFCPSKPSAVWAALRRAKEDGLTLFMAVPTNYALLLREYAAQGGDASDEMREAVEGAASLRLMVSGSMSLPTPVLERWRTVTGHTLLERYGMTELGMALSQPLDGVRVEGTVGTPLPTVEVRLAGADDEGEAEGELYVRGPAVFDRYFRRPRETAEAFDDGWFRTGDIGRRRADGSYQILGRASVDIIKSAGYKISALEIERRLLEADEIAEVAVVGVESDTFGQEVGAVVVMAGGAPSDAEALEAVRTVGESRLARYKLPTRARAVDAIPKNAMGKINKKELVRLFDA
jgi:malonyl-CoA/methylmalonyl-CoA synthetase